MIETIIGSLILMLVSSLGFIAYKHPEYFLKRLYLLVFAISTIIISGISIWNIALSAAKESLTEIIQKDKINMAESLIDQLKVNSNISIISYISLLLYMLILLFVTQGLKDRK